MNAQLKSQLFMLSNAKKKINSLYHEEAVRLGISETALWIYIRFSVRKKPLRNTTSAKRGNTRVKRSILRLQVLLKTDMLCLK